MLHHEKLLKAPLDCGGGVDVDAGEIGVSIGSSINGLEDAPGDEVVVDRASSRPSSEERTGVELASASCAGGGTDCGRVVCYRFSSDPGRLAVQM